MLPSRGLRWSSQTIGLGRRRVESISARNFSSARAIRASPLLSSKNASLPRVNATIPTLRTRLILQHGAGRRFASTTPAAPIIPTSTPPIAAPIDATASSAASLPTTSFDSAIDFSSQSILDIPERIGYLKDLGLDYGYGPTGLMEFILEHIHIYAGTPWWASIALTAIFVRAVMFKPYMDASDNASRMATIQHLTKPVTDKMRAAAALGDSTLTMELRNELSRINARAGIKIWKSFVPMTQVFTGIGTLFLLRAMSNLPVPGLETGGALWFYNLTIPDPFFILPLATAGVLHWVLRRGGEMGVQTMDPKMLKAMTWGLPAISLIATSFLPAGLQLSFFVSGLLSGAQATLLRQPWFRNRFDMVPMPTKPKASTTTSPPSPYKGTLKRVSAGPLSTTELGSRFEGPKAGLQKTVGQIREMEPPSKTTGIFGAPIKSVKGVVESIKDAAQGPIDMAKERMEKNKLKDLAREREAYEKKRQEEIKKSKAEQERKQRAERRARRAMQNKEQ